MYICNLENFNKLVLKMMDNVLNICYIIFFYSL